MRRAADAKSKKVRAIGAGPRDWGFSAVFPNARRGGRSSAIEERSTRLRTESDPLGFTGQCDAQSRGEKSNQVERSIRSRRDTATRPPLPPLAKGGSNTWGPRREGDQVAR